MKIAPRLLCFGKIIQKDVLVKTIFNWLYVQPMRDENLSRWKVVICHDNEFSHTGWKVEYLSSLQRRSKWVDTQRNVSQDDIVIFHDTEVCRTEWKLGPVIEVFPSDDGLVRSVSEQVASSCLDDKGRTKSKPSILTRPISKLTVLIKREDYNN